MGKARKMPKVKHAFIQSGIRFDLALSEGGKDYIEQLTQFHVSGRPEDRARAHQPRSAAPHEEAERRICTRIF